MKRNSFLPVGQFFHGKTNSIVDVPGVKVGLCTRQGKKGVATGVTAILPSAKIYSEVFAAGSFILNGAGEFTGLHQINEWGILETPILLTNTHGVGVAYAACVEWLMKKYPRIGHGWPVCIPAVGECDDSQLNDVKKSLINVADVKRSLTNASSKSFDQGNVGGGTGLMTGGFKSGTGSSSRVIEIGGKKYTLGVLLQSNWGKTSDLKILGKTLSQWDLNVVQSEPTQEGSLVCVIATDAPLSSTQLSRISKRASLGIARCGNTARHGSGEFFVAFSTTQKWKRTLDKKKSFSQQNLGAIISDQDLNIFFEATCDTAEESLYQALFCSEPTQNRFGKKVRALHFDEKRTSLMVI